MEPKSPRPERQIAYFILLFGGISHGLVGAFSYDLIGVMFGAWEVVARSVYLLMGLSAVYLLWQDFFTTP